MLFSGRDFYVLLFDFFPVPSFSSFSFGPAGPEDDDGGRGDGAETGSVDACAHDGAIGDCAGVGADV